MTYKPALWTLLVAHCGQSMEGSFLYTLVLVDVATSWTECIALLRRSEADAIGALNAVRQRLPFPLLGLDTDNGSEFINYELLAYCRREKITWNRPPVPQTDGQCNHRTSRRAVPKVVYLGWRAFNSDQPSESSEWSMNFPGDLGPRDLERSWETRR